MAYVEKVIFDTNAIRNESSPDKFLGGRKELGQFAKVSDIILPDIVIEEARKQKERHLISKRSSFLGNVFHKLRGIDEDDTKDFDINAFISDLEQNEDIRYEVISLTDYSNLLPIIKEMSINNLPPFETGSDKGFKDTYIYFTILEYLENITDKFTYLVSRDGRLIDAFADNPRVHVIKDFEEFQDYRVGYYREDYFIKKLQEEVDETITPSTVQDIWLNIDGNWVIKVVTSEDKYLVEVDFSSKEIIDHTSTDVTKGIELFCNAGGFSATHNIVAKLMKYVKYFSDENAIAIMNASVSNEQIYWIAEDEDVKAFVKPIFESKIGLANEEVVKKYKEYYE